MQIGMRQVSSETVEWFGAAYRGGAPLHASYASGRMEHDLSGGLTLMSGFVQVDDNTVADLGLKMAFKASPHHLNGGGRIRPFFSK